MAEWSKAHAWRACNRQKWFMGSNPILSAKTKQLPRKGHFDLKATKSLLLGCCKTKIFRRRSFH